MRRLLATLLLIALWTPAALAAGQHRYGVVIGANLGDADEEPLLFAERDALRMADVLTGLGGVAPEDVVLLRGPKAPTVENALAELMRRIEADAARNPNDGSMLFVYYSGHANAGELHLGGTRLKFKRLAKLIKATRAKVSVLIVDACRSGGLTRVKGGVPVKAFEIRADDRLQSAGLAIITSSAAGEDAQESDRLRGGIFTHHLLTGLRGGADASNDKQVTLSELYRYAYNQTIRTTSRTQFVQHPTYSFKIRGRHEVTITRLKEAGQLGRLRLADAGSYVVLEKAAGGSVVAELSVEAGTEVLLRAGAYLVRRRSNRAVYETTVAIRRSGSATVAAAGMSRIPFGRTVRKGHSDDRASAWSLITGGEIGSPVLPDATVGGFGAVGAQVDLSAISLQLRVRYGRSGATNDVLTAVYDMVGADIATYKVFDLPRAPIALGLGVRLGGDWLNQRFTTRGEATDRAQFMFRGGPALRAEFALGSRITLTLDGGADIYLMDLLAEDGRTSELTPRVIGYGALGLGFYL